VLLIFFNPQCHYCSEMAPDIASLPTEGKDALPVPVVVTSGSPRENRELVEKHGIRCVVLFQKGEVATSYQAQGTPSGYLIDEQGKIASPLATGAPDLLRLADGNIPEANGTARNGTGAKGKVNRGLEHSRIQRDGLKAGTPAPGFRLPRLGGGELALEDYRGKRVLLVFSDPQCGPCDELAARLQEVHEKANASHVVMVSRRDDEANRRKAAQHGLTFPIVLQKSWEISRRYAMFATPAAYSIDEQGVVAGDVAVGVEPILALAGAQKLTGS
jgi:peroxiredoxin